MKGMIIMKMYATGSSADKLYGYNIYTLPWINLKEEFKRILLEEKCDTAYSGMGLGIETVFAQAALELKQAGNPIKLICVLPCNNIESKWPGAAKDLYHKILRSADEVITIIKSDYKPWAAQKRDEYVLKKIDTVIIMMAKDDKCFFSKKAKSGEVDHRMLDYKEFIPIPKKRKLL